MYIRDLNIYWPLQRKNIYSLVISCISTSPLSMPPSLVYRNAEFFCTLAVYIVPALYIYTRLMVVYDMGLGIPMRVFEKFYIHLVNSQTYIIARAPAGKVVFAIITKIASSSYIYIIMSCIPPIFRSSRFTISSDIILSLEGWKQFSYTRRN